MKRVGRVLPPIGEENRRLRHDRGGYHSFAPIINFVIVETAFAKPEELNHVCTSEPYRVSELALEFSLIQGDLHESHVLVAVSGSGETKTGYAFNDGLSLNFLTVGSAKNLHDSTRDFAVGCRGKETQRVEALFYANEVNLFNNNW